MTSPTTTLVVWACPLKASYLLLYLRNWISWIHGRVGITQGDSGTQSLPLQVGDLQVCRNNESHINHIFQRVRVTLQMTVLKTLSLKIRGLLLGVFKYWKMTRSFLGCLWVLKFCSPGWWLGSYPLQSISPSVVSSLTPLQLYWDEMDSSTAWWSIPFYWWSTLFIYLFGPP